MARLLRVPPAGAITGGPSSVLALSGLRAAPQMELDRRVREIFADSHDTYGAPRITAEVRARGGSVNVKTVAASMRRQGPGRDLPSGFPASHHDRYDAVSSHS